MSSPAPAPSAATSSPAPAATAEPSAVARATPQAKAQKATKAKAEDLETTADAARFLAERRKLRLAARGGESVEGDESDTPAEEPSLSADPAAQDAQADAQAEDEGPEGDAAPTWAQRLREDLAKKTERVQALEKDYAEREARFGEAVEKTRAEVERVKIEIDDAKDEAAYWQSYAQQVEGLLTEIGHTIDPISKIAIERERELAKMKRQMERQQKTQSARGSEERRAQLAADLTQRFEAIRQKHPEVDWQKNPEAREFVSELLSGELYDGQGRFAEERVARAVDRFVASVRWKLAQKSTDATKAQPKTAERPSSSTLSASRGASGNRTRPELPATPEDSVRWLQNRRLARQ
jgi:hypothetical protein